MLARIARTAATIVLALSVFAVGLSGIGAAVALSTATTAPAPATSAPAAPAPNYAAPSCWVEHKSAADGGDERVCGDPALMPAGSTPVTIDA